MEKRKTVSGVDRRHQRLVPNRCMYTVRTDCPRPNGVENMVTNAMDTTGFQPVDKKKKKKRQIP